jgi:hypothetical protein
MSQMLTKNGPPLYDLLDGYIIFVAIGLAVCFVLDESTLAKRDVIANQAAIFVQDFMTAIVMKVSHSKKQQE